MRKILTFLSLSMMAACIKIDTDDDVPPPQQEQAKDYVCDCTYISMNSDPKKEEATKLTNRLKGDAQVDCSKLEGKYIQDSYSGTCVLK